MRLSSGHEAWLRGARRQGTVAAWRVALRGPSEAVGFSALKWAVIALVLLGLYHGLRFAAARCVGAGCDNYVVPSQLVAIIIWVLSTATAVVSARREHRARWYGAMVVLVILAALGPPLSLLVFRDSPDPLVVVVSVLWLLIPLSVIAYHLLE